MTTLKSLILLGAVAAVTCQYSGGSSLGLSSKGGYNTGTSYVSVTRHVSNDGYKSRSSYGGSSEGSSYGSLSGNSYGGQSGAVSYQSSSRGKGESQRLSLGGGYSLGGSLKNEGNSNGASYVIVSQGKGESQSLGGGYSLGASNNYGGNSGAVSYQSSSLGKGENQRLSLGGGYSLGGSGGNSYNSESRSYGKEEIVDYYAKPQYKFEYKVNDPHTGDIKSQQESRDGDNVKGVYELKEPDGTVLEVRYVADEKNGFNAEVIRKGQSGHPEQQYKKSY